MISRPLATSFADLQELEPSAARFIYPIICICWCKTIFTFANVHIWWGNVASGICSSGSEMRQLPAKLHLQIKSTTATATANC